MNILTGQGHTDTHYGNKKAPKKGAHKFYKLIIA